MDDQDKFLAALNVEDFDASLLNCWVSGKIDAKSAGGSSNNSNSGGRQSGSMSPRSNHSVGGGSVGDGYFTQLPPLNTMLDDDGINKNCGIGGGHGSTPPHSANTAAGSSATGASVWPAFIPKQAQHVQGSSPSAPTINAQRKLSPVPVSTSVSIASSNTKGGASRGSSIRPQNKNQAQAQHQLNYNPHNQQHNNNGIMQTSDTSSAISNTAAMQLHPLAIQSSANCPPHTMQSSGFGGMQNNFFPTAMSSLQGNNHVAFAAGIPFQSASSQLSNANALLFQSMSAANDNNSATTTNNLGNNTNNSTTGQQQQRKATRGAAASNNSNTTQQQQQQPSSGNNASSASGSSASMPPFYLFDAPCELRANFMQSQRMHGLPVAEDSNSYHYGVAVNGFHPMNLAAGQSSTSNNFSGNAAATNANSVKLIDARHGNRKAGRIKNEREQRRAQKITELMEQIRASLVTGGWEVRDKSKFHTLSSCADYVKHLIKTTKEQEEAIAKTKTELQMKEKRKAEDSNQNRSDPESVMSSLTSSTGDSRSGGSSNTARSGGSSNTAKNVSLSSGEEQGGRKRKLSSGEPVSNKKSKKESSGTSDSGSSFSGGEEQGSSMQSSGHKVSLFSDLTESNKEASSESGSEPQKDDNDDNESGAPSSTSASSSAAVVKGRDRNNSHTKHADVVIKGRSVERKHKKPSSPSEITSLEESFVLDYEEVFLKSNVPQIIASTAGRLVAWNDFFLKATGVTRSQAKNYTLFQLVPPDKLSSLFEIVAKALRKEAPISSSSGDSEKEKRSENKWDYTTMSLPCIQFPACKGREKEPNPLYITVTLMNDEDRTKRLFHAVFSDVPPGKMGTLGSISPELLSMMFKRDARYRKSKNESSKSCPK